VAVLAWKRSRWRDSPPRLRGHIRQRAWRGGTVAQHSAASSNWGRARGCSEEHGGGGGGGILPRTHVLANLKLDLKPDSANSKMGKGETPKGASKVQWPRRNWMLGQSYARREGIGLQDGRGSEALGGWLILLTLFFTSRYLRDIRSDGRGSWTKDKTERSGGGIRNMFILFK
jgi:hypothetical protein